MNNIKIEINQLENIDWILEAATDLSHATEADLQAMKGKKWYHRLLDMISFSKDNQIQIARDIGSVAKLQEIVIRILVLLSQENAELSAAVKQQAELLSGLSCNDMALLNQLDTSKGAPVENHRRFVASSMILHKMERTYCFHLVGKISERKCKSNDDMNCFSQIAAEIILARYAGTDGCLFLPKWAKEQPQSNAGDSMPDSEKRKTVKKPFVFVNERIDAMNFNAYIDQMFCVIGEKDTEIRNIFHQNQRFLVQDLLTLISALFPPAKQHAWTNEDFYDASVFFREVYPVTETMLTVDFPDIGCGRSSENKEFYNHFRESFTALVADKKSPLSRGRKRYKFVKKKMSLEKRKKTKNKEK